jgi:hypothetical protein
MLELYHHGSSACAAKVRFALSEKRLDWAGHYVNILAGEQFKPEFLAINPKAVVPVLDYRARRTGLRAYAPGPVSMPVSSSGCRSRLVTRCAPMEFAPGRTSRGCWTSER